MADRDPLAGRGSLFSRTGSGPGSLPASGETKRERLKRTYYLPPDVVEALEDRREADRKRTGKRPEASDLVAAALRAFLIGD